MEEWVAAWERLWKKPKGRGRQVAAWSSAELMGWVHPELYQKQAGAC